MTKLILMKEVLDTLSKEDLNEVLTNGQLKFNEKEVPYVVIEINEDDIIQE